MNAFLLMTGTGALALLSSHESAEDPVLLRKLAAKGIDKFIGYQVPIDIARQRYGTHFDAVVQDLGETDDLRVLDFNGDRAFKRFHFTELGPPVNHEGGHEVEHEAMAA
ncbi:MAG: hypothetical protein WCF85_02900 [Rhodospirillaceae bacterium]